MFDDPDNDELKREGLDGFLFHSKAAFIIIALNSYVFYKVNVSYQ